MKLEILTHEARHITFIFCAGFEDRAITSAQKLNDLGVPAKNCVLLKFDGSENEKNWKIIKQLSGGLCPPNGYQEFMTTELSRFREFLKSLVPGSDLVIFDITGCSRTIMMNVLSTLYDSGLEFDLLYTEAEEYYPTFGDFEEIANEEDLQKAFVKMNEFENSKVLHSSHCEIEEFDDLKGQMLPNYPLFLITFLPFKRGRLSAILQALETNVRVLVRGQPVRDDLKWRGDSVDIPNFDLLSDSIVYDVETLDWRATYNFLCAQYENNYNRYRFNFIVAPLGSKMQTVGCWLFAKERPEIRVITSTPKQHYPNKYSIGARDTFLFRDIPNLGVSAAE